MPARTGKCINFGGCNKADSSEVITILPGNEFVCPECEKALMAVGGGRSKSGSPSTGKLKLILFGALGLGLIGAIITWLVIGGSPDIQNLAVEPARIDAGQTATLKWSVEHATNVSIDPALGEVQPEDTFPVSPRGTTTYTLTAKSGSHLVTKSVTLQVNAALQPPVPIRPPIPTPVPGTIPPSPYRPASPPLTPTQPVSGQPLILSFTATPATVQPGQTMVLQWSTRNTRSVSFPGGNPPKTNLPPVGSLSINPSAIGTFPVVLMATGQRTAVRKTILIRVQNGAGPLPGRVVYPPPPPPDPVLTPPPPPIVRDGGLEPHSAPASGMLIWEGEVDGTQLVTIQNGMASPGQLMSGRLPGVQVILQPQNEKKVGIASSPSPDNHYQRVVLRVFGHGHTRVVVNWSTP